jgi:type II secretory pathway component GspD/PulD (secretin)
MKSKILITALFMGLVSQQWAMSQTDTDTNSVATNAPAVSEAAPATAAVTTETTNAVATDTTMAPAASTNESPSVTNSNVTTETTSVTTSNVTTSTTSVTTSNAPETTAVSPEPSAAVSTNETTEVTTNTLVTVSTNALPIQFQDVPLTTAIENLARLAGINYLLDPQIAYGQADQSGKIKTEPTLSVRWENITARQALMAVLDNYGLQLVEDPKTQIARITAKDPTAPLPLSTRVVQLKYASTSNMVDAVQAALIDKRSRVIQDTRTSQLVVVATEKEQDAVNTLVDELDKPTRQVLIETRLMEISSSPSTAKGMDWSGTLAAQNISFGNGQVQPAQTTFQAPGAPVTTPGFAGHPGTTTTPGYTTTTISPGGSSSSGSSGGSSLTGGLIPNGLAWNTLSGFNPAIGFLNADGLHAVLSFLNNDSDAQVIATPRVVTLDNQTAHIEVTRAVPVFASTAGTQGSPGGSTVTYSNLGTILDVTPRITANDYIWLTVQPEVSSVFDTVTKIVAGVENQADEYDIRRVKTQVLIPNANTLVMGGFIKDNTKNIYTKVPFMGDIPILGYAFRHESKGIEKDNLLVFITPTIVQDIDFQPTTTKFLQSSPLGPKPAMHPQSLWESAKPYDWSNPTNTDPYLNDINQNAAAAVSIPVTSTNAPANP